MNTSAGIFGSFKVVCSGEVATGVWCTVGGGRACRVHVGHFQDHRCRAQIAGDVNVIRPGGVGDRCSDAVDAVLPAVRVLVGEHTGLDDAVDLTLVGVPAGASVGGDRMSLTM
jgi:hypothetical protein